MGTDSLMTIGSNAIRGSALRPFVSWYVRLYGEARLDRALSQLSSRDRGRFGSPARGLGIDDSTWYPAPVIHEVLNGLLDGLDSAERRRLARSGADVTIETSLSGLLRVAFRALVSPRVCLMLGPHMWGSFYGSGRVRIQSQGTRTHRMEVREWAGHHPFLCQMNCEAGRAIYEAAGCHGVSTRQAACIDRGDDCCAYLIGW